MDASLERLTEALSDRYAVKREIGRGGMATVYLAHDLKLHRPVALKVLRSEVASSVGADRFLREIQIAAKLSHPNILSLYDCGEAGDLLFYTMPYVEGESLRDRIVRERQLPLEDALRIAREVAEALDYAHEQGLVHRDIKPENILFHEGHAVVADFGIARAVREAGGAALTEVGLAVGTPAYMSPEQAAGERHLDGRSDQYSLGCVLYEMLAGMPPFVGVDAQSIIRQHLTAEPRPVTDLRSTIPAGVSAIITRALAKPVADRFRTVGDFSLALSTSLSAPEIPTRSRRVRTWAIVSGVVAIAALAIVAIRSQFPIQGRDGIRDIVVLPPHLSGDLDQDALVSDLHRRLISAINRVPGLASPAAASTEIFRRGDMTLRELARELGVDGVLEWSATQSPDSLWVEAGLFEVAPGERLVWEERFSTHKRDQLRLVQGVALALAEATGDASEGAEESRIVEAPRVNPEAYRAYQHGAQEASRVSEASMPRAIEAFSLAIRLDPSFAPAYAGLAEAYGIQAINGFRPASEVADSARLRAHQALALDSTLAEGHFALGVVRFRFDLDLAGAEQAFLRAVELDDRLVQAYVWYVHLLTSEDRGQEALSIAQRADSVAPLALIPKSALVYAFSALGDESQAIETAEQMLEDWPDNPMGPFVLINAYVWSKRYEEAASVFFQLCADLGIPVEDFPNAMALGFQGMILGLAGYSEEAERILARLHERRNAGEVVEPDAIAHVLIGLGRGEEAVDWLERAYFEGPTPNLVLLNGPPFEALHGNPRFEALRLAIFGPQGRT